MDRHLVFEISHLANIWSYQTKEIWGGGSEKTRKTNHLFRCCVKKIHWYLGKVSWWNLYSETVTRRVNFFFSPPSKLFTTEDVFAASLHQMTDECRVILCHRHKAFTLKALRKTQPANIFILTGCFSFDETNKSRRMYFSKAPSLFTNKSAFCFFKVGDIYTHISEALLCYVKAKMIRHRVCVTSKCK